MADENIISDIDFGSNYTEEIVDGSEDYEPFGNNEESEEGTGISGEDESEREITFNQIKTVFALDKKNAGCSLELLKRVVLVCFLVNDAESEWDEQSEQAFVDMIKRVSIRLMDDSGMNKRDLYVVYAHRCVDIPYVMTKESSNRCVIDVLKQFGYDSVEKYQQHYQQKFSRDEAPLTFVFNKKFRSFAQSVIRTDDDFETPVPSGEEFSIVSFNSEDTGSSERTFIHELMHQFGAIDFYYPESVKFEAERFLPDSIMNGGETIDSLTRFIIGWDRIIADNAKKFLKAISCIPKEDIEYARKTEWKNS